MQNKTVQTPKHTFVINAAHIIIIDHDEFVHVMFDKCAVWQAYVRRCAGTKTVDASFTYKIVISDSRFVQVW